MKVAISCVAMALVARTCVHSFSTTSFAGSRVLLSQARSTAAARHAVGALSMKKGKTDEPKEGTYKHVRPKKFKINAAEALMSGGVIEMNSQTGAIIKDAPREVKNQAKPGTVKVGTMELYCKAGADGKSLGDCPFTQYVNMVMQYKNLPVTLKPCAPDAKPDWLVEDHEGKMPCLIHDGEAYTESAEIVRYLEYFFPEPSLSPSDRSAEIAKATEVTGGVFPALAKCIKNLDKDADAGLVDAVMTELKKVDSLLAKSGPFLCGKDLTLPDCSFAPKLYHAKVALAQFKNTVIPPELSALHKYMDTIFAHQAFVKSQYAPDVLVWGWNNARGTAAK